MCPSLCASMYTAPVYKGWPSSSFSVQGVSKFVQMLCTNWTLAWAHVYISKQFPSLGTPTSTAVLVRIACLAVMVTCLYLCYLHVRIYTDHYIYTIDMRTSRCMLSMGGNMSIYRIVLSYAFTIF